MSRTTKQSEMPKTAELATSARLVKDTGICATCNEAPTCVNLKASTQPIWHCDQFDDYVPPVNTVTEQSEPAPVPRTESPTNGGFEGLCRHCATRTTCVNRTPGMAVWHCEEYC